MPGITLMALECSVILCSLPYNEGVILYDLVYPNGESDLGEGEVHLLHPLFINGV